MNEPTIAHDPAKGKIISFTALAEILARGRDEATAALVTLAHEQTRIDAEHAAIYALYPGLRKADHPHTIEPPAKRRKKTKAERLAISRRMKAYWRQHKGAK